MAKDYENLTHHESLRYDYLQKNIHFLSDRDRAELHYLEDKMTGKLAPDSRPVNKRNPIRQDLPNRPNVVRPQENTPEGLPVFKPRSNRLNPLTKSEIDARPLPNLPAKAEKPFFANQTPKQWREAQGLSRPVMRNGVSGNMANPTKEFKPETSQLDVQSFSRSQRRKQTVKGNKDRPSQTLNDVRGDKSKKNLPTKKRKKTSSSGWAKRILMGFGVVFLLTLLGMFLMFLKGYHDVQQDIETAEAAEVEFFDGQNTKDGINILVLGTDSRIGQMSTEARTDSIMVVNIGNSDSKIKVVSFMRDTLINIPEVSYEDGFNTYYDQKLNTAFSIGEQNDKQGAEAIRLALKTHFDIDIKYYAMIDFVTFATAIDTIFPQGVKIDARFATVDGEKVDEVQVPDDLNAANGIVPEQTISIGEQYMDGRTLLNYARFRKDDMGDFGRTERQQQVMTAILQQVKDPTKLFTGSAALGKIMGMTSTNIPYSFILGKGVLALGDASSGIERLTVPEIGDWVDAYDMYGGLGLSIDFETYQQRLAEFGLR